MKLTRLLRTIFVWAIAGSASALAQSPNTVPGQQSVPTSPTQGSTANQPATQSPSPQGSSKWDEVIERMLAREHHQMVTFNLYHPIIETYVQEVKPDLELGMVPKSDFYFLGQADFRGRLKVHSMIDGNRKGSFLWSFNPSGFLQMFFVDRGDFDRAHYQFKYVRREFLGEVRCLVFDVAPPARVRGARFVGRIWVEDQDFTIVRINGRYAPAAHFSFRNFEDEYYLHFDSWRTNVKSGMWLPTYIFSQELERPMRFSNPNYKSATRLWGYKLKSSSREEELSRLLVESANPIRDEAAQHDRSPLEAQREWRREAENNVLDLLERDGLLAPPGEVDRVLNTIVNNIEVTNNLDGQIDLRCRVLLTSNLEMFSVGNTIVLSRGLIDVVPDEATLAAMLAHETADALLPKPYQDQYGFTDLLRLSPTEVLKRLSFGQEKAEAAETSARAMKLLKKSPYASSLGNPGLFLQQLHSQIRELKQLISPQLGNQVFFAAQLQQAAPALKPEDKSQLAALPLGSRVKLDPWSAGISLMKTKPMSLLSPRDKMPFEVTPLILYLTRYVETSAEQENPAAEVARIW